MKRVIYFTADEKATDPEKAAIAALNVRAEVPLEILVRNSRQSLSMGSPVIEPTDYVAGTVPTAYNAKPALPAGEGSANGTTSLVVSNAQAIAGITMTGTAGAGKTATFTITGGAITAIAFA